MKSKPLCFPLNDTLEVHFDGVLFEIYLNLMWRAEETLTHEQAIKYQDILCKICVTIDKLFRSSKKSGLDGYVIHASASQRQDAFLELFGKLEQ